MQKRILVADDHKLVCAGLERLINSEADLVVGKTVHDGQAVLRVLQDEAFDILLLDLSMPGPKGLDLVRMIREQYSKLSVLVLTVHNDAHLAQSAIKAGACGFITKSSTPEEFLKALREVGRGAQYMESSLMQEIVFSSEPSPCKKLTQRERQILDFLVSGMSNRAIAKTLHLSEKTVSTHRVRLSAKLGARNLMELISFVAKTK